MDISTIKEYLIYFLPILVLQLGLQIYCIVQIIKNGTRNLNKTTWIILVIVLELLGPILFLILGKRGWDND